MSITLHEGTTFLVSSIDGDVRAGSDQGFYFEDSRFLARFELRLDGEIPLLLTSRAGTANEALFVLTNPALDGIEHKALGIIRHRLLDEGMHEDIVIENYAESTAQFTVSFNFEADFVHIFDVKQAVESGARVHRHIYPVHQSHEANALSWIRLRRAGLGAEMLLGFSVPPEISEGSAAFHVTIQPRARWELSLQVRARPDANEPLPAAEPQLRRRHERANRHRERQSELERAAPLLETDHVQLSRAYRQATRDMVSLRMKGETAIDGGGALAAGIPWYMALFGRDSLIASYQTLLHDPSLARGTLRALARLQGRQVDSQSGEEPGKILHEDRHGPLIGDPKYIPKFPYYGTIDATPLFLVTLSEYVRCTGDLELVRSLRRNVDDALDWLHRYGDRDGDGFIEYFRDAEHGLANQGWKDSHDSVRFHDGRTARGAIALVEVQGYACSALARTAELFAMLGEPDEAERLRAWARGLAARLDSAFWMPGRRYFAEALDGNKAAVDAITSNPGHLLWSGAVSASRARDIGSILMSPAMFSGYGIRTMGTGEHAYNPISYHNGSVWPHDTGLIAAGLARYGLWSEAECIIDGLLDALAHSPDHRLPELFAGYPSDEFGTPIEYPSANRPQAWASGAVIQMARTIIGLDVDALARRVTTRPLSIRGLTRLSMRGVPIGGGRVDIEMTARDGEATTRILGLPAGWACSRAVE